MERGVACLKLLGVAMAPCDVMGIREEKEGEDEELKDKRYFPFDHYFFLELHHHHHHERPPTREYK